MNVEILHYTKIFFLTENLKLLDTKKITFSFLIFIEFITMKYFFKKETLTLALRNVFRQMYICV